MGIFKTQLQPKDLLVRLEKGNRTAEHLQNMETVAPLNGNSVRWAAEAALQNAGLNQLMTPYYQEIAAQSFMQGVSGGII